MTYTHLIALLKGDSERIIKEYLDIALVSASYEIPTAIFLSEQVINFIRQHNCPTIEQSLNMTTDFNIKLYTDNPMPSALYQQTIHTSTLTDLQHNSKHHFIF